MVWIVYPWAFLRSIHTFRGTQLVQSTVKIPNQRNYLSFLSSADLWHRRAVEIVGERGDSLFRRDEKQNGPVKTNASNLSMLKENLFIIILSPKNEDWIFNGCSGCILSLLVRNVVIKVSSLISCCISIKKGLNRWSLTLMLMKACPDFN